MRTIQLLESPSTSVTLQLLLVQPWRLTAAVKIGIN